MTLRYKISSYLEAAKKMGVEPDVLVQPFFYKQTYEHLSRGALSKYLKGCRVKGRGVKQCLIIAKTLGADWQNQEHQGFAGLQCYMPNIFQKTSDPVVFED